MCGGGGGGGGYLHSVCVPRHISERVSLLFFKILYLNADCFCLRTWCGSSYRNDNRNKVRSILLTGICLFLLVL